MPKPARTVRIDRSTDELLTSTEAALRLRVAPSTLVEWRYLGIGPAYSRLETGSIRYWRGDVDAWIDAQRVTTD
jgi:hypothetical protein